MLRFCMQQLAGVESRTYPDYKVKEFQERVGQLEREHKRCALQFVTSFHYRGLNRLDLTTLSLRFWGGRFCDRITVQCNVNQ